MASPAKHLPQVPARVGNSWVVAGSQPSAGQQHLWSNGKIATAQGGWHGECTVQAMHDVNLMDRIQAICIHQESTNWLFTHSSGSGMKETG